MLPIFFRETWPAAFFWPLVVVWGLLEFRAYRTKRASPETEERDEASLHLIVWSVWGAIVLASLLSLAAPGLAFGRYREPAFWAGTVLLAAGVALRRYAIHTLGRFFIHEVVIHSGHQIVDRGPYRWVRHPAYSGSFVALAGLGLALGNLASLVAIVAIPTVAYAYRVSIEERVLVSALGQEYRDYMRRTRRFIPFLF